MNTKERNKVIRKMAQDLKSVRSEVTDFARVVASASELTDQWDVLEALRERLECAADDLAYAITTFRGLCSPSRKPSV